MCTLLVIGLELFAHAQNPSNGHKFTKQPDYFILVKWTGVSKTVSDLRKKTKLLKPAFQIKYQPESTTLKFMCGFFSS